MFDSPYMTLVVSWVMAILIHTGLARRLSLLKDRTKMQSERYRKMEEDMQAISSAASEIRRGISSNTSQVKSLRNEIFAMVQEVEALSPNDKSVVGVAEKLNAVAGQLGDMDVADSEVEGQRPEVDGEEGGMVGDGSEDMGVSADELVSA